MITTNFYYIAQAYGDGTYSNCTYNNATSCTTTGSSSSSGSGLANTGVVAGLIVGVACLIIFVSLVVRFWRRAKRAKKSVDTTPTQDNNEQ